MDAIKPIVVEWWNCECFVWRDGKLVKIHPTIKPAGYFRPVYSKVKPLPDNWKD